jgi:hypothetical protein
MRSHFLVQLNGAFQGQATGETFNFQGKTDILSRVDGKNIFIAEFKFWKGEKSFLAILDQLLSYLSWRDTKAAVVMFNRNADFGAVLAKIARRGPSIPSSSVTSGSKTRARSVTSSCSRTIQTGKSCLLSWPSTFLPGLRLTRPSQRASGVVSFRLSGRSILKTV